jgi:hypothetical protein
VDKWILNATNSVNTMIVNNTCHDLFVEINDTIHCSLSDVNKLAKRSINNTINTLSIAAGNGINGLTLYLDDYQLRQSTRLKFILK